MEWRYHHVKMVERTIGSRPGTGGSAGAAYLRRRSTSRSSRSLGGSLRALIGPRASRRTTRRSASERLLLTGHSHQAWPTSDARASSAWDDAALHADEKWGRAFEKAERVRDGFRLWLEAADAELALDQNTFGLVLRFLSALDLRRRPRLVTTSGEFHTLRRLMARLAEEELLDVVVGTRGRQRRSPNGSQAESNERTAAVLVSAVFEGLADRPRAERFGGGVPDAWCRASRRRLPRARSHVVPPRRPRLGLGRRRRLQVPPARRGQLLSACRLTETSCGLASRGGTRSSPSWPRRRHPRGRVPTGRHALRRRHVRPDKPLPRCARLRLLPGAGLAPEALRDNYLRQTTLLADALESRRGVRTTAGSSRSRSRTPRRSAAASPPKEC